MRLRTTVVTGLLALLTIVGPGAQGPAPTSFDEAMAQIKKDPPGWPDVWPASDPGPEPAWGTAPLPKPSMTEPFAIGEALYDEGRLADAVVSMLALMRVTVASDANASARTADATGLVLSESEVRALIDLGTEDLEASDDIENLPHSFADLYAAVAELLPGTSVEQLAESYTRAYEGQPEDLIAKALMGQPIQPETKLTRAQIWFLLMDGFAGAAATNGRWGTADKQIPDLKSPNAAWSAAEWREVLARLPLVNASRLVSLSAPTAITHGTTANPKPVNVTARANASASPLVSRLTGRTLIPARAGSLSGQEVIWRVRESSPIKEIGTIVSPLDEPVRVDATGSAQLVFQPGVDRSRGTGHLIVEWDTLDLRLQLGELVAATYAVPAPLSRLTFGTSRARANVKVQWRPPEVLWIFIYNGFTGIHFDLPLVGGGTRDGSDTVDGLLARRQDGSYAGVIGAMTGAKQQIPGRAPTGAPCHDTWVLGSQRVYATITKTESGVLGVARNNLANYIWLDARGAATRRSFQAEPPDAGYYELKIFPVTEPKFSYPDDCQVARPAQGRTGHGARHFLPFNDAQWTTPGQGYGIGLRRVGPTTYTDDESVDPLTGDPKLLAIKQAFMLTGRSSWTIKIGRKRAEVWQ